MHFFRFNCWDILALTLASALLLNVNLNTRSSVSKSPLFNSFLVAREIERGWPVAFQNEHENEFVSFIDQERIDEDTSSFLEKDLAITSPTGVLINVSGLVVFVLTYQFFRTRKKKAVSVS